MLICTFILNSNAQDYLINFTSYGNSLLDSVVAVNLTQKKSVNLLTGNILRLVNFSTGISDPAYNTNKDIKVYPNPVIMSATIEFATYKSENVIITVCDLSGKQLMNNVTKLMTGTHKFELNGLKKGVYTVLVKSNSLNLYTKIISQSRTNNSIAIRYIGAGNEFVQSQKVVATTNEMRLPFKTGDKILFRGRSKLLKSFIIDSPASNKTIGFDFEDCVDFDGNKYSTVKIGNQVWMMQNLRTTRYQNGESITNATGNWTTTLPGQGKQALFNNDTTSIYKDRLYNWYAVKDTRNIAPQGWRVPSDNDWTILENYLISNGFNYDGSTTGNRSTNNQIAKSLSATTGWNTDTNTGTVGNNQAENNKTSFTANPYGFRNYGGSFADFGKGSRWWSSTESNTTDAWFRNIYYNAKNTARSSNNKEYGYYVRCIRDSLPFFKTTQYTNAANLDNAVLYKAYSFDSHSTTYFYGSTGPAGEPVLLKSIAFKKDNCDTVNNIIFDSQFRVQSMYLSVNNVKDNIVHYFSYNNDSVYYSIYKHNWLLNTDSLLFGGVTFKQNGVDNFKRLYTKYDTNGFIDFIDGFGYHVINTSLNQVPAVLITWGTLAFIGGTAPLWVAAVSFAMIATAWSYEHPIPTNTTSTVETDTPAIPKEPKPDDSTINPCSNFNPTIKAKMDKYGFITIEPVTDCMYAIDNGSFSGANKIMRPNTSDNYTIKIRNSNGCVVQNRMNLTPAEPNSITVFSGNNQTGIAGHNLPEFIIVQINDQNNDPYEGATVNVVATNDGSALSTPSYENGKATIAWKLGNSLGIQNLTVNAYKSDGKNLIGSPLTLTANSIDGSYKITRVSEDNLTGSYGKPLPSPIEVLVTDIDGKPFEGKKVNFSVNNGGSITPSEVITDVNGKAKAIWTMSSNKDFQKATVTANKSDGYTPLIGSPLTFNAIAMHDTIKYIRKILENKFVTPTVAPGASTVSQISGLSIGFSSCCYGASQVNYYKKLFKK